MAKLKDNPITKDDINEYLRESSDFAFEILVLRRLTSLGFDCEHAGTYADPITKKTREFDIRARKCLINEPDLKLNISLSVECKNLRSNFPLVVHCMPRKESERYLDLVWASKSQTYLPLFENTMRIPITGDTAPYQKLDPVGKSCDQIGRKATQDGELIGNDADVFDKISQAINAAYDLLVEAHYAAEKDLDVVTIVIPVLIVPNERIWTVWYNLTGGIEREPSIEANVEYYINKSWLIDNSSIGYKRRYYLSHLEIVQIDKIDEMISKYTKMQIVTSPIMLREKMLEHLHHRNK